MNSQSMSTRLVLSKVCPCRVPGTMDGVDWSVNESNLGPGILLRPETSITIRNAKEGDVLVSLKGEII